MRRTIAYRGFEINIELTPSADDTFNVTFQIKGGLTSGYSVREEGAYRCAKGLSLNDRHISLPKLRGKLRSTC